MSLSIMSGIAEGHEQIHRHRFLRLLYGAKGSCAAMCSHLYIALDQGYIDVVEHEELIDRFKKLSIMIDKSIGRHKTFPDSSGLEGRPQRGVIKKELEAIFDAMDKQKA